MRRTDISGWLEYAAPAPGQIPREAIERGGRTIALKRRATYHLFEQLTRCFSNLDPNGNDQTS